MVAQATKKTEVEVRCAYHSLFYNGIIYNSDMYSKHMQPRFKARRLRLGQAYRRSQLRKFSAHELQVLVKQNELRKAASGIYYRPRYSRYGELPPEETALIKAFLQSSTFLAFSPILFNGLGLGGTQLSKAIRVYNYKRSGKIKLAGRLYDFRRYPRSTPLPEALNQEFLLVEFLNGYMSTAEEIVLPRRHLEAKLKNLNQELLSKYIQYFGNSHTQKIYAQFKQSATITVSPRIE